jgi:hypothetical protein
MPDCSPHGFFLFGLVAAELSILNYLNEQQVMHTFVGRKRELKLLQAG